MKTSIYKSYVLEKGQFLSEKMKENRLLRSEDVIWFFQMKIFLTKIRRLTEEMIDDYVKTLLECQNCAQQISCHSHDFRSNEQ